MTGPNLDAATTPSGPIAYVSGWPRVPKSSAAFPPGSKRDRPLHVPILHPLARVFPVVLAHDAEQDDARIVPVRVVPGGQGVVLLAARNAPRVPEVHEHRLAGQALGRDRNAVEAFDRERRHLLARPGGWCSPPSAGRC